MICVSIGRGRHKHMIAEHRHLVEQGAELVELRLDYIRRAHINLKRLIGSPPCPVIVSVRRQEDGGKWEGSEEARLILLRSAIAEGVDYVDLEMDVAPTIPRFGDTKRIVSYHNFHETPEDLDQIHARMCEMDADVVKLATMAHRCHDNLRMLKLVKSSSIPTVGMCMGDIGTPSRLLCGKFGAPFTYATFHHERALAPGQLSFREMKEVYNYDGIGPETEIYGVVADPVAHSLSPLVHNIAFQKLGLNKAYVPFRVPRDELGLFFGECQDLDVAGLSVTIPHKESSMAYLSEMTEQVRHIGAVNTILFQEGHLQGHNTDCDAALASIIEAIGEHKADNPLAGRSALVLGAGGVARAVAYGLHEQGADVTITNRNPGRAYELADRLECKVVEWESRHEVRAGVLVNCTPVGMHPNVDETAFPAVHLARTCIVFDTVYNPEQTLLIKEARNKGCRTITGVELFVRQAAMQCRLFTGQDAPADQMREQVHQAIGAARRY